MYITFVWLYVSWFHSQGYGLAAPSARLSRATFLALLAAPGLMRICWVSFGAWLLGRSNYDCIGLAKLPLLLCIEKVKASLNSFLYISSKGRMMPCCTIYSRLPMSGCASRHAPCVPL